MSLVVKAEGLSEKQQKVIGAAPFDVVALANTTLILCSFTADAPELFINIAPQIWGIPFCEGKVRVVASAMSQLLEKTNVSPNDQYRLIQKDGEFPIELGILEGASQRGDSGPLVHTFLEYFTQSQSAVAAAGD